ncbi:MAG TPA: methyltransferase domain-containing protein [Polyangiaceae bacterium]|nr:methyltransferase domain-containing protein [Polyangiaceae bacterium]
MSAAVARPGSISTAGQHANDEFIACWNDVLTPKWLRFRHLLSGQGKVHGDVAMPLLDVRPGQRVLDVACGFGESSIEIGQLVGPRGGVLGLDCTRAFLEIAEREREQAGLENVRYELGDAESHPLPPARFDLVFSRFGVMFFRSAVRALRGVHRALVPGGAVGLLVWRRLEDNPAWGIAKQVALEHLPAPQEASRTCGPGPFSWADEDTDRRMLHAAGFGRIDVFERIDRDICVGRTIEEALDYQVLVGPAGEIVREAGEEGTRRLPAIRAELAELFRPHLRADGVYLPSSTWIIVARK